MTDILLTVRHIWALARTIGLAHVVWTKLRGDPRESSKTFTVRVGEGKSLAYLVGAGSYPLQNVNALGLPLHAAETLADVPLRLVTVKELTGKDVATDAEILAAIPRGEQQATNEGVLAFGARHQNAQRKALIIGDLAIPDRVLILSAFGRVRYACVDQTAGRWRGNYRVLLAPRPRS